jgi:CubicO group peptidase (beta-lactamase class C family)
MDSVVWRVPRKRRVMRANRLVFSAGYGSRGANERVPVWSLSKAITAVCIASFIKEGRLRLNDPIGPVLAPVIAKFGEPNDEPLARISVVSTSQPSQRNPTSR